MGKKVIGALVGGVPGFAAGKVMESKDKAKQQAALSEQKANEAKASQLAAEEQATKDLASQKETSEEKLKTSNEESRRSALSNFLASEGSKPTSRRRFLVGAK